MVQWGLFEIFFLATMGRGQVVRHLVLVQAFGGPNPSVPARKNLLESLLPSQINAIKYDYRVVVSHSGLSMDSFSI